MNILFNEKSFIVLEKIDLENTAEYLINMEKFQVKSVSNYFESLKMKIISNLKTLGLKTHFSYLYLQTKLNQELVPLKSPLYISFLMKFNAEIFNLNEINPFKLAWTVIYHSYLDLTTNIVLEETLKNMINSMRKNSNWVNQNNVEEILEIIIMIDHLKLYDVKIPNSIIKFFDKEIIANLLQFRMSYTDKDPNISKVIDFISREDNIDFEENKLTNIIYVDVVVERSDIVRLLMNIDINLNFN